jgi:hypothetical protein
VPEVAAALERGMAKASSAHALVGVSILRPHPQRSFPRGSNTRLAVGNFENGEFTHIIRGPKCVLFFGLAANLLTLTLL